MATWQKTTPEMEAGLDASQESGEESPLTTPSVPAQASPWARRAVAAVVGTTAVALLATNATHFGQHRAVSYSRVKDGVTVLQEAGQLDYAAAAEAGQFDMTEGDPDAAGGADGVKDQFRTVDPNEPYAQLRLPPGIAADQRDVTESVVNLPTEPWPLEGSQGCSTKFQMPAMPELATQYNGAQLPDTCFQQTESQDGNFHVYLIGDWGGLPGPFGWNGTMEAPAPADHRSPEFPSHERDFIWGADDCAQRNIAKQMRKRAATKPPDYILNVGDNFYWGGIDIKCGGTVNGVQDDPTHQWEKVFENVYTGPGIDGKQWLGVMGNHDFGGFMFVGGWDQVIHYTWMQGGTSTGRWVLPALYYAAKVNYPDFSIDYLFVDTNVWDTWLPHAEERHNLCSRNHNPPNEEATCGRVGPISADECPDWFKSLWQANIEWMENALFASTAEWQVIVTHFPPEGEWGGEEWGRLVSTHGIDLIVTGHRHRQEMHTDSHLSPTTYVVTGGGGGITSENPPDADGEDDEYGFVDMTLTRTEIMMEMISHGGQIRSTTCVTPRQPGASSLDPVQGTSLCEGKNLGIQPLNAPAPPPAATAGGSPSVGFELPPSPAGGSPSPVQMPAQQAGQQQQQLQQQQQQQQAHQQQAQMQAAQQQLSQQQAQQQDAYQAALQQQQQQQQLAQQQAAQQAALQGQMPVYEVPQPQPPASPMQKIKDVFHIR